MNDYSTQILKSETFDVISRALDRFITSKASTRKTLAHAKQQLINPLKPSTVKAIEDCGSWLEFRHYKQHDKTKLHHANFCKKDKLCPACAVRRTARQVQKVERIITKTPALKKKHWYYIVLPVKHDKSMSYEEVSSKLRTAKNTLRQQIKDSKRGKGRYAFMSRFDGLFYSHEVTYGKNGWNCHLNLLCCSDAPVHGLKPKGKTFVHDDLINDWHSITGDSYIVSINPIDKTSEKGLMGGLLEVFKYALKFQALQPAQLLEVYEKSKNMRFYGAMGSLYGIKLDVDLEEEALSGDYIEFIFRYLTKERKYIHHSTQEKTQENSVTVQQRKQQKPETKKKLPKKTFKLEIYDKQGQKTKDKTLVNLRGFSDFDVFRITQQKPLEELLERKPRRV